MPAHEAAIDPEPDGPVSPVPSNGKRAPEESDAQKHFIADSYHLLINHACDKTLYEFYGAFLTNVQNISIDQPDG